MMKTVSISTSQHVAQQIAFSDSRPTKKDVSHPAPAKQKAFSKETLCLAVRNLTQWLIAASSIAALSFHSIVYLDKRVPNHNCLGYIFQLIKLGFCNRGRCR